jgi:hypothetical protein
VPNVRGWYPRPLDDGSQLRLQGCINGIQPSTICFPVQGYGCITCGAVATAPRCIHVAATCIAVRPAETTCTSLAFGDHVLVGGCPYAEGAAACQTKKNPGILRFPGCVGILCCFTLLHHPLHPSAGNSTLRSSQSWMPTMASQMVLGMA